MQTSPPTGRTKTLLPFLTKRPEARCLRLRLCRRQACVVWSKLPVVSCQSSIYRGVPQLSHSAYPPPPATPPSTRASSPAPPRLVCSLFFCPAARAGLLSLSGGSTSWARRRQWHDSPGCLPGPAVCKLLRFLLRARSGPLGVLDDLCTASTSAMPGLATSAPAPAPAPPLLELG